MPLMVVFEPKALPPKQTVTMLGLGLFCIRVWDDDFLILVKGMVEIYVQVMGDYIWDV